MTAPKQPTRKYPGRWISPLLVALLAVGMGFCIGVATHVEIIHVDSACELTEGRP